MAGLKVSERQHMPTLREFLSPVIEDMNPENDIEDQYRVGYATTQCILTYVSHCLTVVPLRVVTGSLPCMY
jgi:hypothetical protein